MENQQFNQIPEFKPTKLTYNLAVIILTSFVMFVIMKVGGIIDWSWWWVTSPLWIAAIINIFSVIGIYLMLIILKRLLTKFQKDINNKNTTTK